MSQTPKSRVDAVRCGLADRLEAEVDRIVVEELRDQTDELRRYLIAWTRLVCKLDLVIHELRGDPYPLLDDVERWYLMELAPRWEPPALRSWPAQP